MGLCAKSVNNPDQVQLGTIQVLKVNTELRKKSQDLLKTDKIFRKYIL